MPRILGYLAAIANNNVVSVCLGVWRISRPAQAKSEIVQWFVGASPHLCAQRPRTQVRDEPENILNRIIFFDIDSRPVTRLLSQDERRLYLREIKEVRQ
jgi:hypothetical protein